MHRPKRILVVLEGADTDPRQDPALSRALFFAREMRLGLHLLRVDPQSQLPPMLVGDSSGAERDYAAALALFSELGAKLQQEHGVTISADLVRHRHQYQAVIDKATALRPDFVVKGTYHDTTLKRTLFNYTDWYLIRHCPCPLLLVKSEDDWATRRIVACVNPAHVHGQMELLDNVIIEAAQQLAYRLRGDLHIFHSIEGYPLALGAVAGAFDPDSETRSGAASLRERHADLVDDLLRPYRLGGQRVHLAEGRPEKTLVPFAEELAASLVVMGAVSRGALGSLLIGNTAERVLDALHCDVLVVKCEPLTADATAPADCVPC
jgi:universal stress protein E